MQKNLVELIKNDPDYKELVAKRSSFAIKLSIIMLIVYFGFILLIAYFPEVLGAPLSEGSVTTVGIPVGMGIIFFAFIITGIYTKRANGEFDDLNNKIKEKVKGM
ncbi:DUF485 domain-containing protein [Sulfurimonas sp.]|jgi:uncharacterized membrane protein (DUF485 family)|uniref:DUF485 domain-containing protein n=1 Tax=Sulfurimonas sp. TaxID=2022749 RepID=UPI0025E9537A|nr:DUF485 domain-containing protein [Sulfurimonas sp.]MCK9474164.1 DUF485 domain-containing protein [Sulfurimonas sp.]MDD3505569.1 DUF485 domain-containing protein [Sulfurimonas sp.]